MSYRSIKRVLGETSLERKCRLLFGACLFVLITASFWWYGNQTEKMVYERNPNTGRLLVDQILYLRHWESLETNKDFQDVVRRLTKSLSKEQYKWTFIKPKSTN
ncbi:MAG: sensor histidine kinase, partial [Pirellulaceae bacterium]|nr:sensor histidine kinase [Pirellulaceae bacterium]